MAGIWSRLEVGQKEQKFESSQIGFAYSEKLSGLQESIFSLFRWTPNLVSNTLLRYAKIFNYREFNSDNFLFVRSFLTKIDPWPI